jgi:endonuclease/exonuclease/phosphatase (EEP) superfamily protein YafD
VGNPGRLNAARLVALGLVGALALGLSPAADANTTRTAAAAAPQPVASTVRIASFNTAAMSSTRQGFNDVKSLLAAGTDIVALQEMSSWARREKVRTRLLDCETCTWDGWIPVPAVQGGQPILWRSDKFTLLGRDWIEVAPETYVGPRGAGPSTMHAKYVVRVRLLDKATGRTIWILNNHFVPTVQSSDGGRNDQRKRIQLYAKHMAGLQAVMDKVANEEGGGLVFITGDFNVNYRKDKVKQDPIFPYAALGAMKFRSSYNKLGEPATGTHVLGNGFDKRLIDYVNYKPTRRVIAMSQRIVTGMNSDHRPLVVDFKVVGKGCYRHGELIC